MGKGVGQERQKRIRLKMGKSLRVIHIVKGHLMVTQRSWTLSLGTFRDKAAHPFDFLLRRREMGPLASVKSFPGLGGGALSCLWPLQSIGCALTCVSRVTIATEAQPSAGVVFSFCLCLPGSQLLSPRIVKRATKQGF